MVIVHNSPQPITVTFTKVTLVPDQYFGIDSEQVIALSQGCIQCFKKNFLAIHIAVSNETDQQRNIYVYTNYCFFVLLFLHLKKSMNYCLCTMYSFLHSIY